MKKTLILFVTILPLLIFSCRNNSEKQNHLGRPDSKKMIELNRYIITKDRELIINYCERKNIKAEETSTGLWYAVLEKGNGPLIKDGDTITFEYDCSLLDGTLCYSSKGSGPKKTRVGYSTIESGLLEGLKLMNRGAEYIFIIPPYLAHGIPGDGNRIPGRSIIVYRIKVIS